MWAAGADVCPERGSHGHPASLKLLLWSSRSFLAQTVILSLKDSKRAPASPAEQGVLCHCLTLPSGAWMLCSCCCIPDGAMHVPCFCFNRSGEKVLTSHSTAVKIMMHNLLRSGSKAWAPATGHGSLGAGWKGRGCPSTAE